MPLLGVLLIFISGSYLSLMPAEGKRVILIIVALSTFLLPLSLVPFFYYQKIITKVDMPGKHERIVPIATTTIFYFFGYFVLRRLSAPDFIQSYILASFVCVLMATAVNVKWKISLHMIGVGGLIGLISMMSFALNVNVSVVLAFFVLIAGVVGSARLYLNAHSNTEIYSGFLLGFVGTFATMLILYV
jgi:hypothetical protein